jgi:hypothetical protein
VTAVSASISPIQLLPPRVRLFETIKGNHHVRERASAHNAVIHVYDEAGNVIEMREHTGEFKEPRASYVKQKAATR